MKRLLFLISIICLLALSAQAQRVMVSGKVMDAQTKESLHGANIYLRKQSKGATSDVGGHFKLSLPKGNNVEMTISYVGYQSQNLHFRCDGHLFLPLLAGKPRATDGRYVLSFGF